MITSEEIKRRLWSGANELRGSMDASRYKDYMLGLMFYKFLSDKTLEEFKNAAGEQGNNNDLVKAYFAAEKEYGQEIFDMIQFRLGYYVKPLYLYQTWINDINSGDFEVQKVIDSLNNFELSIATIEDSDDFKGLFSNSTLDLTDTALGSNLKERSINIQALIQLFADLNMVDLQKGDVLGDAYEYLIGQFAMESGKKAGEFYTPRQVSEVMAQIVAKSNSLKSIYDPTVGSGSLLLTVRKHLNSDDQQTLNYYGQEKNTATYNLTRMNLLLHGVMPNKMTIRNADTLSQDWPEDPNRPNEGVQFDAVVMNPPYSLKSWNKSELKVSDPRFEMVGTLPPESKGDFAFLLHGLFHLGQNGTMAIVLPHGVLFRGSSEGEIRQKLLEKNYIDTIIGLPSGLFTNTSIPVIVMILKKNRNIGEPVLIMDASKDFIKSGKQNALQEKDIAKIVDVYVNRSEIMGYSHLASRDEIIENQYNMNIPRYIDSTDVEIPHDVEAHLHGGIPLNNIKDLKSLNDIVPDLLNASLNPLREGYVELNCTIEELTNKILNCQTVKQSIDIIKKEIRNFVLKYYADIKNLTPQSNIHSLMEEMLKSIKNMLIKYEYIDVYDGYQVIASIWKESLLEDAEKISLEGFYKIGRTRIPHMVMKGSGNKKHEEQDGWIGSVIPNNLIADMLFMDAQKQIDNYKNDLQECESRISELIETAKSEDNDESQILNNCLNDAGEAFDTKCIKANLKQTSKDSNDYKLLKEIESLFNTKSSVNKRIKESELKLRKEVQDKIESLTNEEIDSLLYKKWFGGIEDEMMNLVTLPLKQELEVLKTLNDRYSDTLESLDLEMAKLEAELNKMMAELVVTKS